MFVSEHDGCVAIDPYSSIQYLGWVEPQLLCTHFIDLIGFCAKDAFGSDQSIVVSIDASHGIRVPVCPDRKTLIVESKNFRLGRAAVRLAVVTRRSKKHDREYDAKYQVILHSYILVPRSIDSVNKPALVCVRRRMDNY